ncbi:hypothetical protein BCR41DRAFT_357313 [Lobosporangium transversale]|uniref:GATA-type domain-containing protein n=1 Tax=Lobosporangium transversale TaxID=64571 RepID=A0A1Y2GLK3_9FUNG|nr:hypothetical protein BCR41DRAFT_357313 [Lobosporangium transversale]ORZ10992.1 hypothetical protein BCR41DRAFT_357313 [Lobosporangium transversale]|eukprot:XP_021879509.1 hypothetical protein BCR41DRAFT_357313 [Lobosporangium transversale]
MSSFENSSATSSGSPFGHPPPAALTNDASAQSHNHPQESTMAKADTRHRSYPLTPSHQSRIRHLSPPFPLSSPPPTSLSSSYPLRHSSSYMYTPSSYDASVERGRDKERYKGREKEKEMEFEHTSSEVENHHPEATVGSLPLGFRQHHHSQHQHHSPRENGRSSSPSFNGSIGVQSNQSDSDLYQPSYPQLQVQSHPAAGKDHGLQREIKDSAIADRLSSLTKSMFVHPPWHDDREFGHKNNTNTQHTTSYSAQYPYRPELGQNRSNKGAFYYDLPSRSVEDVLDHTQDPSSRNHAHSYQSGLRGFLPSHNQDPLRHHHPLDQYERNRYEFNENTHTSRTSANIESSQYYSSPYSQGKYPQVNHPISFHASHRPCSPAQLSQHQAQQQYSQQQHNTGREQPEPSISQSLGARSDVTPNLLPPPTNIDRSWKGYNGCTVDRSSALHDSSYDSNAEEEEALREEENMQQQRHRFKFGTEMPSTVDLKSAIESCDALCRFALHYAEQANAVHSGGYDYGQMDPDMRANLQKIRSMNTTMLIGLQHIGGGSNEKSGAEASGNANNQQYERIEREMSPLRFGPGRPPHEMVHELAKAATSIFQLAIRIRSWMGMTPEERELDEEINTIRGKRCLLMDSALASATMDQHGNIQKDWTVVPAAASNSKSEASQHYAKNSRLPGRTSDYRGRRGGMDTDVDGFGNNSDTMISVSMSHHQSPHRPSSAPYLSDPSVARSHQEGLGVGRESSRASSVNSQNGRGGSNASNSRNSKNSDVPYQKYRKRAKRTQPPGRCLSCDSSDTPEWRRGPDGARTLCNACGLHYAKLVKRQNEQAQQQKQIGSGLSPMKKGLLPNNARMAQLQALAFPLRKRNGNQSVDSSRQQKLEVGVNSFSDKNYPPSSPAPATITPPSSEHMGSNASSLPPPDRDADSDTNDNGTGSASAERGEADDSMKQGHT